MKHIEYQGIPITVEFQKGEFKPDLSSSVTHMGWTMYADYGFIDDTVSMEEGDALDVFVGDCPDCQEVYWFELLDKDGVFNEYKLCLGYESEALATQLMQCQYGDKVGSVLMTSLDDLKDLIEQGLQSYEKQELLEIIEEDAEEESSELLTMESSPMMKSIKEQPLLLVSI